LSQMILVELIVIVVFIVDSFVEELHGLARIEVVFTVGLLSEETSGNEPFQSLVVSALVDGDDFLL